MLRKLLTRKILNELKIQRDLATANKIKLSKRIKKDRKDNVKMPKTKKEFNDSIKYCQEISFINGLSIAIKKLES